MSRGFLLDTNVLSEQIRSRPEPKLDQWLYAQKEDTLFLRALTIGELRKGIVLLPASKRKTTLEQWLDDHLVPRFITRILPVTRTVADRWGVLSATRRLAGNSLGAIDGLILATALDRDLIVVTRNTRHFADLGAAIFNPWGS